MTRRAWGDAVTLLLTAALGMVVEIAAGRLLAPHVGMSLYTWTAVIAVVVGGFSVGHLWGGRLADRLPGRASGHLAVAWMLGGCALTCAVAVPLLHLVAPAMVAEETPPLLGILGLALTGFLAPSLLVGAVSPPVMAMAVREAPPERVGRLLGRLSALGAFGAIAGTLVAGFAAVPLAGSSATMLGCAGLYAALAAAHGWAARGWRATVPPALVVLLLPLMAQAAPWRSDCQQESGYFCLRFDTMQIPGAGEARLLVLDHLAHGINLRDAPELLVQPYLHLVDELASARGIGAAPVAFFAGGGALTLPRAWSLTRPGGDYLVAEIDPDVSAFAAAHLWFTPGPPVRLVHRDARVALQALPAQPRFDLVLADAFLDLAMPAHLTTREWHRAVRARLLPGGAYLAHVLEDRADPRFLLALARTLALDFPVVEVWVEARRAEGQRVSYLLLASDTETAVARLSAAQGPLRDWARLPAAFVATRAATSPVLTDDRAPVEALMTHLLLDPKGARR